MTLPYLNVGDKIDSKIQPQCFGFFNQEFSSHRRKANVKRQFEFEKYLHLFPSLEDEFLACAKSSEYLRRLIEAYIDILRYGEFETRWENLNKDELLIGKTDPRAIFDQGHLLASHVILQEYQHQLDIEKSSSPYRKLAIDELGLVTINSNLGPRKFQYMFPLWNAETAYTYLSKLTLPELERLTGPVRFLYILDE